MAINNSSKWSLDDELEGTHKARNEVMFEYKQIVLPNGNQSQIDLTNSLNLKK